MPYVHNKSRDTAPSDAVYIGRGSPYGNPYSHREGTKAKFKVRSRDEAIDMYEEHVLPHLDLTPLIGKDLVCFCKPKRCHGDSILRAIDKMLNPDPFYS